MVINYRVVDTVVGRVIAMVIFCSVAAFKRLLAQGLLTVYPILVIIGMIKFVVVFCYRLFEATCKHLVEN